MSFALISLKILQKPRGSLSPAWLMMVWAHCCCALVTSWTHFKTLHVSHLLKLSKLPGFGRRHLASLFPWFLLDENDKLFQESSSGKERTCSRASKPASFTQMIPFPSEAASLILIPAGYTHSHPCVYILYYPCPMQSQNFTEAHGDLRDFILHRIHRKRDVCMSGCQ